MGTLLLLLYICLFLLSIFLLAHTVSLYPKKRFRWVYLTEFSAMLAALLIMWLSDHAPGTGIMPGLTYFDVFFYSLCAAAAFALLLLISLVIGILVANKRSNS